MRAAKKRMESHMTDCNDIWRSKMQALLFFALFKGQMAQNDGQSWVNENCTYYRLFFRPRQKNSRMEKLKTQGKTQNSSKKLKDSANFGVICCKNEQKRPKKGETTKIPKSRMNFKESVKILKQKN